MAEKKALDPDEVHKRAEKVLKDLDVITDLSFVTALFIQQGINLGYQVKERGEQVLDEVSFEGVAKYIRENKCKNIITMAGAGISTSAGIPDFRSEGTGLYDNLQKYNLPFPEAIFTLDYFKEKPEPFFVLAKELLPGNYQPTPCHYFIRLLHEKGLLLRHYTQNIDTLERVAGLPEDKLVEAHGTFHSSHCLQCRKQFSLEWMKDKIRAEEIPKCSEKECGGIVKPDIVFFGEQLPRRFVQCSITDFQECDLLIILGTSLKVHPFNSIPCRVSKSCPRLYINLQKADPLPQQGVMGIFVPGTGFDFDSEEKYRDVFRQSTCDDGCVQLAKSIGWEKDLRKMIKASNSKTETVTRKRTARTKHRAK